MIRVSNKKHPEKEIAGPQVHFVDRVVEVPVEQPPLIEYIDRPVETVVVQKEVEKVDLQPLHDKNAELDNKINIIVQRFNEIMTHVGSELEMQRRAFIAVKMQRDIDRKRRLMFIRRIRKEHKKLQKQEFVLKCALGASFLLTVISLIIKL